MKKLLSVAALSALLVGCVEEKRVSTKTDQARKAQQAAETLVFSENAEIENIKRRLELTSKPGALGFILLLNEAGQPILYAGVKGKVTSGGKRLTPPVQLWNNSSGGNSRRVVGPAPSDEGTWGSSSEYIYFWTVEGQYYQWSGRYLYSDKPFRLSVEPLVIELGE